MTTRSLAGGTDRKTFVLVSRPNGHTVDVWLARRRVIRMTRRRARVLYGPVSVLRAHKGGRSVLRSEVAGRPWLKARLICGVLLCSDRWGTVMVQWRGFARD